ncbi:GumC domain-containing protein [Thiolapillus brandeum]|uniref:Polysaccharide chain length determinant N-terminal domain-containing protein n=1 Tax=Thiolapillus brandeum TaxID=1076588 RepID=A0A7U6GL62_9GAMM|nr:hypothetical protein [Thiolapillus brandeum]BAO45539.1 hypothetical protein TBH_C2633 [Thiolapillus brandeum]
MSSPTTTRESSSREAGDEFDPIAVLNIVVKRKRLFLSVLLVVLVLGVLVALTRTPQNSYVSVLQIGSAYGSNSVSGKLVEDTDGVVTKLQRSVIPQVVSAWATEHPDQAVPQMIIKGKRSSGIVLIMTKAGEKQASMIADLHRSVAGKIIGEHKTLVMTQYESFLSEARKDLVASESEIRKVRVALGQQKVRKTLLGQQLQRLNREIATLSAARQEGMEQEAGEEKPSALYLVPLDLPAMLERRDSLEDELKIKQDLILAELQSNLSNAESNRLAAIKKIDLLKNEINSLRLTRIQTLASAMPDKIGLSPKLVMVFSLVLGLLAAWFAVMFADYWQRQLQRGSKQ